MIQAVQKDFGGKAGVGRLGGLGRYIYEEGGGMGVGEGLVIVGEEEGANYPDN